MGALGAARAVGRASGQRNDRRREGVREYGLAAAGITDALFITEVWHPTAPARPSTRQGGLALDDDTLFLDVTRCWRARASACSTPGRRPSRAPTALPPALTPSRSSSPSAPPAMPPCSALRTDRPGQRHRPGARLWHDWGEHRLHEFRTRLNRLACREMQWRATWTAGWE